ncbi:uncharacterized protein LOC101702056 [Heterocephalus glaber]|uniref:Uncharacterized protein LOC101702056 n=1 Tax=Heterocephalus glaber TaxID=10181 RepID=A0AAX6Q761_HETGA|nr:uncharacterized protein LOC101702056 [Heterocephalus glaber]
MLGCKPQAREGVQQEELRERSQHDLAGLAGRDRRREKDSGVPSTGGSKQSEDVPCRGLESGVRGRARRREQVPALEALLLKSGLGRGRRRAPVGSGAEQAEGDTGRGQVQPAAHGPRGQPGTKWGPKGHRAEVLTLGTVLTPKSQKHTFRTNLQTEHTDSVMGNPLQPSSQSGESSAAQEPRTRLTGPHLQNHGSLKDPCRFYNRKRSKNPPTSGPLHRSSAPLAGHRHKAREGPDSRKDADEHQGRRHEVCASSLAKGSAHGRRLDCPPAVWLWRGPGGTLSLLHKCFPSLTFRWSKVNPSPLNHLVSHLLTKRDHRVSALG